MLGDLLRDKRKQLNLTLEDVEKGTNIRKLYITALEDGNYDKLPKAEVFCKGFIKSYGKFLNLDTDELIAQYEAEKGLAKPEEKENAEKPQEKQAPPVVTEEPKKTVTPVKSKINEKKRTQLSDFADHQQYMQRKSTNKKKFVIIISGIVIFLVLVIALVSNLGSNSKNDAQPAQQVTETAATETKSPLSIVGTFNKDTWTIVSVDGKEVLAQTVTKGTKLTWDATKNISILAKDPEAISISINGGEARPLANNNQELTVVFTLDDNGNVKTEEMTKTTPAKEEPSVAETPKETKPQVTEQKPAPVAEKPAPPAPKKVEPAKPAPAPAATPAPPTKEAPSVGKGE